MRTMWKHSMHSIVRMPFKTALFFLLVLLVSVLLYVGVNTWVCSAQMLREADETYDTIAVFTYLGENYPDQTTPNESMDAALQAFDYTRITEHDAVLSWQPTHNNAAILTGFTRYESQMPYRFGCVLVVSDPYYDTNDLRYYAKTVTSPYSYRERKDGSSVFFFTQNDTDTVEPAAIYAILGVYYTPTNPVMNCSLTPFDSLAARSIGFDCDAVSPLYRVDDPDAFLSDPDNPYYRIADYYRVMNNAVLVKRVADVENYEAFHQERLYLTAGRYFTPEEVQTRARVCILVEDVARKLDVTVGDAVPLNLIRNSDLPLADCYFGEEFLLGEELYQVVGVTNSSTDDCNTVFVPGEADGVAPVQCNYIMGQAHLKNGTGERFYREISPYLDERTQLAVYDHGYQSVADTLTTLLGTSIVLTVIAAAAALVVLALYAYLFVGKQHETVETMRCLGAKQSWIRTYLLTGSGSIVLLSAVAGSWLARLFAGKMLLMGYRYVASFFTEDLRFSNGSVGVLHALEPIGDSPAVLVPCVAGAVFLLSLAFCLFFSGKSAVVRQKRKKPKLTGRRPPKRSSRLPGGAVKFACLSAVRGGLRSAVVVVVSAVMVLLSLVFTATAASYAESREQLIAQTTLTGRLASLNGKTFDGLLVKSEDMLRFHTSGYLSSLSATSRLHYLFLKKLTPEQLRSGDGLYARYFAPNEYVMEKMLNLLDRSSYLVMTNDIQRAPEFYLDGVTPAYADGYDDSVFADWRWERAETLALSQEMQTEREAIDVYTYGEEPPSKSEDDPVNHLPPCLVSTSFMQQNGVAVGDAILIQYSMSTNWGPLFFDMPLRIVGSFHRQGWMDNIYVPMPTDPVAQQSEEDARQLQSRFLFQADFRTSLRIYIHNGYYASCAFTLRDANELAAFKAYLEECEYSDPSHAGRIRTSVLVNDKAFNDAQSDINQRIRYMQIMEPGLYGLMAALGLILAFLTVSRRKEEIAIMRGLGIAKGRVFLSFFVEQALLGGLGVAVGMSARFFLSGVDGAAVQKPLVFLLFYLLGSALALLARNGNRILTVLNERE